jgi:hypothetical protein
MTLEGVVAAVSALHARILSDLGAQVATINAAVTDEYTILNPDPQNVLDYMPSVGELVSFPTVGIEHGPGRFEDDTGWSATGVYDLIVVTFVQHAEPQGLARLVRRHQLAMLRTIMAGRNLGSGQGIPWGVTLRNMDFGPALTRRDRGDGPPDTYMTWSAIAVQVKLDED